MLGMFFALEIFVLERPLAFRMLRPVFAFTFLYISKGSYLPGNVVISIASGEPVVLWHPWLVIALSYISSFVCLNLDSSFLSVRIWPVAL